MFDSDPMDEDHFMEDLQHFSSDIYLDVPFVPTDDTVIEAMLELGKVGPNDILYDLGCGDGRIVVAAAMSRHTSGVGIELDPMRVAEAMEYAADSRVEFLVDFIEEDLFEADVSEATVVTLYLLHAINVELRPRLLQQLRPGARIISHAFDMGDWEPDDKIEVGGIGIYLWVVPANVAGEWEWEGSDGTPYRVKLKQKYQQVSGQAWQDGKEIDLKHAVLKGNRLELELQGNTTDSRIWLTLYFENNELMEIVEEA